MKRLTFEQQRILNQMGSDGWYSAYDLQCRLSTLEALKSKGYVERRGLIGAAFSPRTALQFKKVELCA